MREGTGCFLFTFVGLGFTLAIIALKLFIVWVVLSCGLSVFKSLKDDCGRAYSVESVFAGDWFCPMEAGRPKGP